MWSATHGVSDLRDAKGETGNKDNLQKLLYESNSEKEAALKEATKPEPKMEFLQKNDLRKLKDVEGGVKEHGRIKEEFKKLKSIIDCLWQ